MFTRNYWMVIAADFTNKRNEVLGGGATKPKLITVSGAQGGNSYSSTQYGSVFNPIGQSIHNFLRYVKTVDVSQNLESSTITSNPISSYGLIFGSGNTPATIDDYKLSGDAIQNISTSYTDNSTYEEDGSASVASYTYTITNNNDTDITIGEVGLFSGATWNVKSYSIYTHHYYMYERTALETPITIPAGGVGQVTYTIRMEYPVPPIEE